jgi:hypothetical protein
MKPSAHRNWSRRLVLLGAIAAAAGALTSTAGAREHSADIQGTVAVRTIARATHLSSCTIVVPARRATLEARLPDAADFCELVSHALTAQLFHAPTVVVSDRLWHYPEAALNCRLQYQLTLDRLTIRNAPDACTWFKRHAPGWHVLQPEQ